MALLCNQGGRAAEPVAVADAPSQARATDNRYIAWIEHIIDDPLVGGIELSGSDGLDMADLDRDGFEDIVSVHESDTTYHGKPTGHVRIAWGSADPNQWQLETLASGPNAAAAEDVSIADANGDGFPDVVVAAELAHLIYFTNPGQRGAQWPHSIVPITTDRGSYIRTFFADFNGDGHPEVVAPNKGAQNPGPKAVAASSWVRHDISRRKRGMYDKWLARDLDRDGDMDFVGTRGNSAPYDGVLWLEQHRTDQPEKVFTGARNQDSLQMPLPDKAVGANSGS